MPLSPRQSVCCAVYLVTALFFHQTPLACAWQENGEPPRAGKKTAQPNRLHNIAPERGNNFADQLTRGEAIYLASCADCHGKSARGVEGVYDDPLEGDLPVVELAKYVADTMPEGEPEICTGEDARLVSQYLHHRFYSRTARLKNNPPKIAFSRRTVKQYQNAVADIMGQLKWEGYPDEKRGLNAKYFATRKLYKGRVKLEKIEPVINFDYGEDTPYPEEMKDASQFSIYWGGGIIAKETGVYEFIVTSPNGFRLSVNEEEYTIDNNVNSTDQTEFKASVKLTGGQAYPISITMFKFNEKKAGMKLEWIPPGGIREIIPESVLSPGQYSASLVFHTEFPADDSSVGYARGTAISQQWDSATTSAAIEAMAFIETHLEAMMDQTVGEINTESEQEADAKGSRKDPDKKKNNHTQAEGNQPREKEPQADYQPLPEITEVQRQQQKFQRHRDFAEKFVTIALGRRLSDDERRDFITSQFQKDSNPLVGLKRTILLTLKSPQFLYLTQSPPSQARATSGNTPDDTSITDRQNAVAANLANIMWDSIPDQSLRQAAGKQELANRKLISDRAWEMLDQPRTRQKLADFFYHWLEMEKTVHASKDKDIYPGFDQALIYSLRWSIDRSLEEIVWSEKSDYRQLFLFDEIYVNDRISSFYEIETETVGGFVKTKFESDRRCGILTHPYLMTGLSYYKNTSPIHRGVFVAKSLLGRSLKAPPVDVDPLDEDFDPTMTTRERVTHQTKEVNCKGCHSVINPLGFSLENFDAVGRFRDKEKNQPIDSKTVYVTPEAREVPFSGAKDLADYLVNSPDAHRNFIEKLFQHFVKQPVHAYGPNTLDTLYEDFAHSNFNIRQLIVNIAVIVADRGDGTPGNRQHAD